MIETRELNYEYILVTVNTYALEASPCRSKRHSTNRLALELAL